MSGRHRVTLPRLAEMKRDGEPIVMVTAYDYPTATVVDEAGVDLVLVGDSAAMVVLGYPNTTPVSMDEMVMLSAAVRRGLKTPLLIGDMPFGSYEASDELAIANAQRFIKEAGCDAVKLERGGASADRAKAIVDAGIPVMGHVGLTPQSAVQLGGFRAQGRTAARGREVIEDALQLQEAGCFAIVLEAIPSEVTAALMPHLQIPAIGIGAGPAADGQVLVYHDLLGIWDGRPAKFVRQYAQVREEMLRGVSAYANDVRARTYPAPEHGYGMAPDEAHELHEWADRLIAEHSEDQIA
jgi:3-methyl-2-oxobutanoate hydroxymethyltransferase